MTLKQRQRKYLFASIKQWEAKFNAAIEERYRDISIRWRDCPCCIEFQDKENCCNNCPIAIISDDHSCINTPYLTVKKYLVKLYELDNQYSLCILDDVEYIGKIRKMKLNRISRKRNIKKLKAVVDLMLIYLYNVYYAMGFK